MSTLLHPACHASAPPEHKCADCTMDQEPCPDCYAAWWAKQHPNVILSGTSPVQVLDIDKLGPKPVLVLEAAPGDRSTQIAQVQSLMQRLPPGALVILKDPEMKISALDVQGMAAEGWGPCGVPEHELWVDFGPSCPAAPVSRVVEMARLPSGRIVVMTQDGPYWFEADGRSIKGSALTPWPCEIVPSPLVGKPKLEYQI